MDDFVVIRMRHQCIVQALTLEAKVWLRRMVTDGQDCVSIGPEYIGDFIEHLERERFQVGERRSM